MQTYIKSHQHVNSDIWTLLTARHFLSSTLKCYNVFLFELFGQQTLNSGISMQKIT